MRFDLENLNPGKWFYFDDDETAGVCLRVAPASEIRRITKATSKKGKGVDQEALDQALWDYCINDWNGIEDANGEAIECNAETKATLMGGAPDFAGFVTDRLAEIREAKLSERSLEKN
jgi:hypothetical protein